MLQTPLINLLPRFIPGLSSTCLGLGMLVLSLQASARDHFYGVHENAALLACEKLHWEDRDTEAGRCYRDLMNPANPPLIRAEAMWALDELQTANSLFQTAVESEPESALIRLRWGELFLDTYQYQEAYQLFQEALEIEPDNAFAHIGAIAAISSGGGDPEVINSHVAAIEQSLSVPPGAELRLLLMTARTRLEQDDYEKAQEILDDAEELASDENLPAMEINALKAAHAFMTRHDYLPFVQKALTESPGYGDAWAIPGYFATVIRMYREAVEFFGNAVEVEPGHWQAHMDLGQNQLRLNLVSDAQYHVRLSYEGDPYNPKTVNLLRLLDTFIAEFQVIAFPDPPEAGTLPTLMLRLHRDEKDILKHYAQTLAENSIATFSERYRFTPKEPIIIEIFPNHEDFVVRSVGMPGVGILGVTFGYLFAMDSPSGHPDASYHWGTTLWHEMAHVFTLEATGHAVPRWFSEGISVYEEWHTGPIPGIKIPNDVLLAMHEGKFLPISELDDGFMRPTYQGQVIVSYMQAGLVFHFLSLEYGHDSIVDILYQFNNGVSADQAMEKVLGISTAELDRHFKQFIDIEFGSLLANLDIWRADMQAGFQALQDENWQAAISAAEKAIFTYPDYVETDSAYLIKARAHGELGQQDQQLQALETFWKKGGYAPDELLVLAQAYVDNDRDDDAIALLNDINYADPFHADLHVMFGDILLEHNQPENALQEYLVNLALDPVDMASANFRVAKAYHAMNNQTLSMDYLMTALDIAPQYRPAQLLLLELSRNKNQQSQTTE